MTLTNKNTNKKPPKIIETFSLKKNLTNAIFIVT